LYLSILTLDEDPHEGIRVQLEAAELARRAGVRNLETTSLLNAAEGAIGLGQWDEARVALGALRQRELAAPRQIQLALCEAMLAAFSGDTALAFERLETAADSAQSENRVARSNYHLMRAHVHLASDDLEVAYSHAAASVAEEPSGVNTPAALAVQMRAALWLRDATRARETLDGMEGFRGRWMAAVRLTAEAGLMALEGRHDDAFTTYERALEAWRALDSPLDLALCALDRAVLRGSRPAAGDEDDEAREIFTRLGATPFFDRLERAEDAARKVG
jgi:tetratricopeptide (TPR) repeat protein